MLAPHAGRVAAVARAALCYGPVDHYLGRLALVCGDAAAAAAHLERALAWCERAGAAPGIARARAGLADARAGRISLGGDRRGDRAAQRADQRAGRGGAPERAERGAVARLQRRPEMSASSLTARAGCASAPGASVAMVQTTRPERRRAPEGIEASDMPAGSSSVTVRSFSAAVPRLRTRMT